jgi:hydrogenase maturation protease
VSTPSGLVIGIGNSLRQDDGLGLVVASQAHGAVVRLMHQLTPELAAELVGVDRVLFVDAWCVSVWTTPHPCLLPLEVDGTSAMTHQLQPAQVLAICAALYQHRPRAALLLLPAHALGHGTGLSGAAAAQLPRARALLRRWLRGDA